MDESDSTIYWCHACERTVNPILEIEEIKCPICQGGFVEEMAFAAATPETETETTHLDFGLGGSDQDRALSLWAPILFDMIPNPHHRRRSRRAEFDDDDDTEVDFERRTERGNPELDQELESFLRRRRRNSASILHVLQGIRAGMVSEFSNSDRDPSERYRNINNGDNHRETEHVIVINPFNQTIILDSQNRAPLSSLGDYFMGPGLDLLLQHLAENDPNRYGTPPAQKDVVEALPTMKVEETLQCSVCLDDCEIGCEVKEMPCKHKFHSGCILPWLELHSSCPICRHQLPSDESKVNNTTNSEGLINNGSQEEGQSESSNGGGERRSASGRSLFPWPFDSLFSSSRSSNGNSSTRSQSRESRNANGNTDDN